MTAQTIGIVGNPKRKKRRNRQRTMALMLKMTDKLIIENGVDQVGISQIAQEANVNKVLIYRYFGGISGIIEHLFQKQLNDLKNQARLSQSEDEINPAEAFMLEYNRLVNTPSSFLLLINWIAQNRQTAVADRMLAYKQEIYDSVVPANDPFKGIFLLIMAGLSYQSLLTELPDKERLMRQHDSDIRRLFIKMKLWAVNLDGQDALSSH